MRKDSTKGAVATILVLVLVLVLALISGFGWTVKQETIHMYRGNQLVHRADQLARAAIAEAVEGFRDLVNIPCPTDGMSPDTMLDGWYRQVRPQAPSLRKATLGQELEMQIPEAQELASEEGFDLTAKLECVVANNDTGVPQGVIECSVVVTGGKGPRSVRRRLVERRRFYNIPSNFYLGAETEHFPTECIVSRVPLGRVHESFDTP